MQSSFRSSGKLGVAGGDMQRSYHVEIYSLYLPFWEISRSVHRFAHRLYHNRVDRAHKTVSHANRVLQARCKKLPVQSNRIWDPLATVSRATLRPMWTKS
ncbi:hypothetical protein EVAR_96028_1 [Eumeta japonica]|uniref:Uncharacterized protein n=1 Tax=Eumeta variegata TaxID=151549 RepID=A0A4C1XF27_EUMVA|nr:hypothetical protein EVAR_96028_1 [Eumeta japonica]